MLLIAVVAVACSGGLDETGATPDARATGDDAVRDSQTPTPFSGTLQVGDLSYEFTVDRCGFDPEDAGNRDVRLIVDGSGIDADGNPFRIEFFSLFDGQRHVQSFRLELPDGRELRAQEEFQPEDGMPFAIRSGGHLIEGTSEFALDAEEGAMSIGTGEVRMTCPPYIDGQAEGGPGVGF